MNAIHALSQLSYGPKANGCGFETNRPETPAGRVVEPMGFEPTTS